MTCIQQSFQLPHTHHLSNILHVGVSSSRATATGTRVLDDLSLTPTRPPLQVAGGRERREKQKMRKWVVYKLWFPAAVVKLWGCKGTLGRRGRGVGCRSIPLLCLLPVLRGCSPHRGQPRARLTEAGRTPSSLSILMVQSPWKTTTPLGRVDRRLPLAQLGCCSPGR